MSSTVAPPGRVPGRGLQLALGVVAMMAISSPQYVWTLFVEPFRAELGGASLSAVQATFAIFSIFQCGLGPLHGHLASRFSPRVFVAVGGLLVGASWILSSLASSLPMLYLTYGVLSGIGTGFVYVAVIELMVQYWPERRGFAVGLVTGSYGFGAICTTFPIAWALREVGLDGALSWFGAALAIVIVLAALGMKRHALADGAAKAALPGMSPGQMLKTPVFWVLLILMTMVATGGLMVISQLGPFAASMGIGPTTTVLGMAALPLALTIDRIANGATRPFFGWLSDKIGREPTMFIAFALEAIGVFALLKLGDDPVAFVVLSGLVFFGWGQIYALFPSLQADLFGPRYAVQNFGYLLVGTAVASVLGAPVAAKLLEASGSWDSAFYAVIVFDALAAILSVALLAPMTRRIRETRAAKDALSGALYEVKT